MSGPHRRIGKGSRPTPTPMLEKRQQRQGNTKQSSVLAPEQAQGDISSSKGQVGPAPTPPTSFAQSESAARSSAASQSEDPVELCLAGGGRVPGLIGRLLGHVAPASGRGQILEHGGVVGGEHVLEVGGHGVGPEEVVVEGVVAVRALSRVQDQQLVDQVEGVGVLHVGLETLLHLPLLPLRQLHLLVQLILLIHTRPHLRGGDERTNV